MAEELKATVVSDPERVRALAHPIRLALLDLLEHGQERTATQCAEAIGESVASCSFHLRILAKYGFIEAGERRGREKPWRAVNRRRTATPDFDDPASVRAVGALAELTLLRETERIAAFLANIHRLPPELRDSVGLLKSAFWATPAELAQLSHDLQEITSRFTDRWERPDLRPDGARLAILFAALNPELDPEP
ncbi:ArsR/SmtB family transcription factor [Virgisporangium aurantiacum]|uniref:Transcriptional regulator n=1 Tax=Virgisporangium aurantiacum TaxID=175570 RepID=A0A8J3Z417_9ACTN|nr:winged helix-turn-helix domain-containing protein [Virgisporangium aurantiacum]GIJ56002.1 transcriptional regulator [Virgisporangium aurantiacum]